MLLNRFAFSTGSGWGRGTPFWSHSCHPLVWLRPLLATKLSVNQFRKLHRVSLWLQIAASLLYQPPWPGGRLSSLGCLPRPSRLSLLLLAAVLNCHQLPRGAAWLFSCSSSSSLHSSFSCQCSQLVQSGYGNDIISLEALNWKCFCLGQLLCQSAMSLPCAVSVQAEPCMEKPGCGWQDKWAVEATDVFGKAWGALLEKLCTFVLLDINFFPNLVASVVRISCYCKEMRHWVFNSQNLKFPPLDHFLQLRLPKAAAVPEAFLCQALDLGTISLRTCFKQPKSTN